MSLPDLYGVCLGVAAAGSHHYVVVASSRHFNRCHYASAKTAGCWEKMFRRRELLGYWIVCKGVEGKRLQFGIAGLLFKPIEIEAMYSLKPSKPTCSCEHKRAKGKRPSAGVVGIAHVNPMTCEMHRLLL